MSALDKQLPNSPDAERDVLGSVLLNETVFDRVTPIVSPSDFFSVRNREVFEAMTAMDGKGITLTTLREHLRRRPSAQTDAAYISSLIDGIPDIAQVEKFAEIVRNDAKRREIIIEAERLQAAVRMTGDVSELATRASHLFAQFATNTSGAPLTARRIGADALKRLDERTASDTWITGIATGLRELDGVTLGLQRGVLSGLGARPARGKTAVALNVALNAARAGLGVYFVELDMSPNQIGDRVLATLSGVNSFKIRSGRGVTDDDLTAIIAARRELHDLNDRFIVDTRSRDIARIASTLRRESRQRPIDLLVVDHIGHIRGGAGNARYLQLGDVSNRLIDLAGELGIAVLALCQLGRDAHDRKPVLSDLRESGNLEQDCRLVVLLDSPASRGEPEPKCALRLIVAKNEGETHEYTAHFELESQRTTDEGSCRHCASADTHRPRRRTDESR